jgi:D-serine deaminase-like pyridoxal phosphate-dependent protein
VIQDRNRTSITAQALAEVPTPSLIVDLATLDTNIRAAENLLAGSTVALRPHYKAHKCTRLLWRQLRLGNCRGGVTCQTSWEALILARKGFQDVLVSNQIVDPSALARLVSAAHLTSVTVAVDSPVHVAALESAASRAGVHLGVLIEVDVGLGRCGLPPGSAQLLQIARALESSSQLTFKGLQAYEGHAVQVADRRSRRALVRESAALIEAERTVLAEAGFPCAVITGGGTGTMDLAVENGVLDEVQAGSYVLYDASYATLDLPFRPAVFCVATVVSKRDAEFAVVDAGLKQLSTDSGFPIPTDSRVTVLGMSDEHTRVRLSAGADYAIGDRITLIPSHVDPTVNLHPSLFASERDNLWEWPVDGRTGFSSGVA